MFSNREKDGRVLHVYCRHEISEISIERITKYIKYFHPWELKVRGASSLHFLRIIIVREICTGIIEFSQ